MNQNQLSHPYRSTWTTDDIRSKIECSRVVVFAKGTEDCPRCGFTERVLGAVRDLGRPYELVDVIEDRSVVPALKAFSGELQLPVVYIDGNLINFSENQERLLDSDALKIKLESAFRQ